MYPGEERQNRKLLVEISAAAPTTLEFPDISADLEQWKFRSFDQMDAGWASLQKADLLVIGQNTFSFSISIN